MAPLLPKRKGLAVSQGALAPFLLWFPDLVDLSTVVVATTTCLNYYLSSICIVTLLARTSEGEVTPLARTFGLRSDTLSTWKTAPIHGQMWKTAPGAKNWAL